MDLSLSSRFKNAWNAFRNRAPTMMSQNIGSGYSYRPDRFRLTRGNERSIVTSVYNRIALDVAAINIQHVQLDDEGRFLNVIKSGLNECLSLEANLDQTGRAFIQDVVMSMMDEGCVAIIPVDTDDDPDDTKGYQILSMRVGRIRDWYPRHVRVEVYNENTGRKQEIVVPKDTVSIVENPLYAVINEPNSTMQRLIRKLNLLDAVDEQSSSGKLDLIIQLPYVIKSEARRQQAEKRRKDIEQQLSGSKYGIAYTDGTERITQLNRSLENNLMKQIEYLTSMLYSQLGITQSILDGTADEKTMLNYYNRTIEPIISAIVDEMKRKFLTKTARAQNKSIMFFRDPFKLVPVADLAEISDKFTRNEIATSNEIRQVIGWKPSADPKADELRNSNLSEPGGSSVTDATTSGEETESSDTSDYDALVNEVLDSISAQIDDISAIEIPSGLSKAERSKRVAERTAKIAKLRNDAKSDKAKISSDAKTDKASVRTDATNKKVKVSSDTKEEKAENQANAKSERAKVSSELKAAVKSVREAYKAAKADLDSSYEQTYQDEFDKIQSEYKKVKKSKKKSSSSSKKTSHPLSYYIRK